MERGRERRAHPRIQIKLKVEYTSLADFFVDYATDISHGGMFVATDREITVGNPVSVRLVLPGTKDVFQASGKVVRKSDKPAKGVGIKFDPLSDTAKVLVEKLWEKHIKET